MTVQLFPLLNYSQICWRKFFFFFSSSSRTGESAGDDLKMSTAISKPPARPVGSKASNHFRGESAFSSERWSVVFFGSVFATTTKHTIHGITHPRVNNHLQPFKASINSIYLISATTERSKKAPLLYLFDDLNH